MKQAPGKLESTSLQGTHSSTFRDLYILHIKLSYRAGPLATGVLCDPAETSWTSRVPKLISSK